MTEYFKKHFSEIAVFLIAIFFLISHTLYVAYTHQYPEMDEQHYMDMAVQFYRMLQHPTLLTPIPMIQYIPFRQPGYSFLILPLLLVFGIHNSYFWGLWVNGVFYGITIVGVYFLAKEYISKAMS